MKVCPTCNQPFVWESWIEETLMGYFSPEGHDHDDNCRTREMRCAQRHVVFLSLRNRCSVKGCDWVGKDSCDVAGHGKATYVDEWPPVEQPQEAAQA